MTPPASRTPAPHRLGLVGCGEWGKLILRDLRLLGADVAVAARSPASRRNARKEGASKLVDTASELPEVEAVVVATPASTHADVLEPMLARGVPIFVEKPLTTDPLRAAVLEARAEGRVWIMEKWRWHPGVRELKDLLSSGALGALVGMRTVRAQWGLRHRDVDCAWALLPHDLSIWQEVAGPIPVLRFAAAEMNGSGAASFDARFGDGPWLQCHVSTLSPVHVREVRLHGTEGIAVLDDAYARSVRVWPRGNGDQGEPPAPTERPIAGEMPLLAELRAFLLHLEGGPPPRGSLTESAAAVRAIAEVRGMAGVRS